MIAEELVFKLKEKQYHITTAESCTGGLIAAYIVEVSGASDVFEEGYVTYSNRVKEKNLGVSEKTIEAYTVVSEEVASEMAEGVRKKADVELSVSVTGYAGPDDGEDGTPAGTVYIGTSLLGEIKVRKYQFSGERNAVRKQAAEAAILFAEERLMES